MIYINQTLDFQVLKPSAITFGKFDGLHRGHELLIRELLARCRKDRLCAIAFTFDIPPKAGLAPEETKVLTTNAEKRYVFEKTGMDYLIECPFRPEVMSMEPDEFLCWIVKKLSIRVIIAGDDFHFGKNRRGDYRFLQSQQERFGYQAVILEKIKDQGRDISSTYIREMIQNAQIERANALLGYPFFIRGLITHGNQIGRTIGFPTINLLVPDEKLLPPFGVYVSRVRIGEAVYPAVSNVGRKPTVGREQSPGVETFIFDFQENVYEQMAVVEFLHFLRPERKFASMEELSGQLQVDIREAENYSKKNGLQLP